MTLSLEIKRIDVDYREVARLMRINIDILKEELTEHVNNEIVRFKGEIDDDEF
jgi:hypothetical protein